MSEALTAEPLGPQTDTLAEQPAEPNPVNTTPSTDDVLRSEIDRVVKGRGEEKLDDEAKEEKPKVEKPDAKAKPEPKEEPEAKEDKPEAPEKPKEADTEAEGDEGDGDAPAKPKAFTGPPAGFNKEAAKEWDATPESVRNEVYRRNQEMERGIHRYKQDAEQFEGVRHFAEMAKQSGTDLPTAMGRYVEMENALRQNPMQGLQQVVANLGLTKSDGSPITLRDVAATIMGQTPDQAASRQEATISQLNQQIAQLQQQIGGFSKHVEQQQQQSRVTSAESTWAQFQASNPRAAELEPQIAEFLTKYTTEAVPVTERLQDAYNWAVSQSPNVAHTDNEPLVQTQPVQKAVNPAGKKSISGTGGENRAARIESTDEALKRAIAQLNR